MWFLKRKKTAIKNTNEQTDIRMAGKFLEIDSIEFFGLYSKSRNGQYILAWSDFDRSSGTGGFRQSGYGTHVLLHNNEILLHEKKLQRPNDGQVSNNGTFILNDWMFGEGLKGTFFASDVSGRELVKHEFEANLLNNGLSEDGSFAICQTAASTNSDSGTLSLFNLENGSLIWQQVPITGWADSYEFNVNQQDVSLVYKDKGKFKYNFNGDFMDDDLWQESLLKYGNGFELHKIAHEKLQNDVGIMNEEAIGEAIDILELALTRLEGFPKEKARVYRTLGEVFEEIDNIKSAIAYYELALKLDSKVGVKRKLNALKKESKG